MIYFSVSVTLKGRANSSETCELELRSQLRTLLGVIIIVLPETGNSHVVRKNSAVLGGMRAQPEISALTYSATPGRVA